MKLLSYSALLLLILLAGCRPDQIRTDISGQTKVFGIELYSGIDYREIGGVVATEEACLKGYERSFEALDIIIGYGFDAKTRKITTRNPSTGLFGISPGMPAEKAKQLAQQAGFTEISNYRYRGKGIDLALLVDGAGIVFGLTAETH